ncbi:PAS domain S-box protein [Nakamurella sp. GG22]
MVHGPNGPTAEHDSAVDVAMLEELAGLAARNLRLPLAEIRLTDGTVVRHPPQRGTGRVDSNRIDPDQPHHESPADRAPVADVPLLTTDGEAVGSLTVHGTAQTVLTAQNLDDLRAFARIGADRIVLQRRNALLASRLADRTATRDRSAESQRVLNGILAHTDAVVYAKDLAGRFIVVNPAAERAMQFPTGIVGKTAADLLPADQAAAFRRNDELIATAGTQLVFEEEVTLPGGAIHTYRSAKFPLLDDQGRAYAVAGVAVDVTDLAAARQAHHEAEQRWQTLVEHSPVAVAVLDGQARFRYVNPRLVALLDADNAESLLGRTCLDIVREDRRTAATSGLSSVIAGGAPILSRRSPMRTFRGIELTVEFSLAAIVDHGEPAVLVEVRDVTGAAAAEEALRSSEERFHTVFSDSPAPMGIADENGRWVDVNDALGDLMGVEPAVLIGARPVDFVHPEDRADFIAAGREHLRTGRPTRQELRCVRTDGEIRWLCLDRAPMAGPTGSRWVLGVAQDSTARKTAELALLQSRNDLAAVAAVAKCVQSGDDPRPLVAATIRSLSGADSVSMIEAAGDGSLLVTAADGGDLLGRSLSLGETSVTAEVWRSGERVFIPDITADARVHPGLMTCDRVVGALWQPVTVQGRVEAVIVVGWRHRIDDLGDRAVRVVEVVADEAGASLRAARLHRELERSANTDPLTGSLNRRAWDRELHTLMDLAQLTGEPLAVAVVDLDHFKAFNDHFGHVAGDALLAEFADAAARCLRKQDVFARWGGEEFVVALPDCTQSEAAAILDRVRLSVPSGLSCSIGHTTWVPGEALTSCIGRADSALYNAKKHGRNRVST